MLSQSKGTNKGRPLKELLDYWGDGLVFSYFFLKENYPHNTFFSMSLSLVQMQWYTVKLSGVIVHLSFALQNGYGLICLTSEEIRGIAFSWNLRTQSNGFQTMRLHPLVTIDIQYYSFIKHLAFINSSTHKLT